MILDRELRLDSFLVLVVHDSSDSNSVLGICLSAIALLDMTTNHEPHNHSRKLLVQPCSEDSESKTVQYRARSTQSVGGANRNDECGDQRALTHSRTADSTTTRHQSNQTAAAHAPTTTEFTRYRHPARF